MAMTLDPMTSGRASVDLNGAQVGGRLEYKGRFMAHVQAEECNG